MSGEDHRRRRRRPQDSSSSENKSSGRSTQALYYGTSQSESEEDSTRARYANSRSTRDSRRSQRSHGSGNTGGTTASGFTNYSNNPHPELYGSSTNPSTNPRSAEHYRATQGVPQQPILYGEYENRTSTSTYPTDPRAHRDDYRDAVAKGVPEDSQFQKLNDEYKAADAQAERTKEDYRKYRKNYAASEADVKAERKKKIPDYERRFRGVPAGTKNFHETAKSLVETAIQWADHTEQLRTRMGTTYIATESSKKSADGHKKRAADKARSADKLRGNLQDHERALDSFRAAESAAQGAAREAMERLAVGDEEPSDFEDSHRRSHGNRSREHGERRERRGDGDRRRDGDRRERRDRGGDYEGKGKKRREEPPN